MTNPHIDQFRDDMKHIMSSYQGRRAVWHFLGLCGEGSNPFAAGMPDVTGYNCGMQNAGILMKLALDHDQYVQMMNEAKERANDYRPEQPEPDPIADAFPEPKPGS